ncbi:hypothetical protein ASD62_15525 [Phycicoccus sp. Root563]|nr:hypothetical protein ASD62_15525 [Phycicoccus sp. Root563]
MRAELVGEQPAPRHGFPTGIVTQPVWATARAAASRAVRCHAAYGGWVDPVIGGTQTSHVHAPPEVLWQVVTSVGGDTGWFTPEAVWAARCGVDRVLGGPGRRRVRPDRPLRLGDKVDFWTVTAIEAGRHLVLSPDTRLPGSAFLELDVAPDRDGSRLTLRHGFVPDGVAGRLYGEATRLGDVALYAWMHRRMVLAAEDLAG